MPRLSKSTALAEAITLVCTKKRIITKEKGERILLDLVREGLYLKSSLLAELLFIIKSL